MGRDIIGLVFLRIEAVSLLPDRAEGTEMPRKNKTPITVTTVAKDRIVGRTKASFTKSARTELLRLVETPWREQAEGFAEMAKLGERANRPFMSVIDSDREAKAAWVELRRGKLAALEARRTDVASRTHGGGELGSLIPAVHGGVNVFAPPYDFQEGAGRPGSSADRQTGRFGVSLPWGHGGARWATAGVGLALTAGVQGVAHIRPAWRYDWQGTANGHLLDSHTEGAGQVVVQDQITGAVLLQRTWPLWNFNNDNWEDQNGFVDSWALGADVFVNAGQLFTVTFLATAMVADSGTDYLFGWSLASAWIEMQVLFVVVEMGP